MFRGRLLTKIMATCLTQLCMRDIYEVSCNFFHGGIFSFMK